MGEIFLEISLSPDITKVEAFNSLANFTFSYIIISCLLNSLFMVVAASFLALASVVIAYAFPSASIIFEILSPSDLIF